MTSPLSLEPLVRLGAVSITAPVVITWVLMIVLAGSACLVTRRLSTVPTPLQSLLEIIVEAIDSQIAETMHARPAPFRALIGTIFLYILAANWTALVPGIEPPTAHLETDTALALIVFGATMVFGIRARGLKGYLATFAEPSWVMIPLNLVEQVTRTFSLIVRLFGNVMSGVFVIGVVLSLAGLVVPIPLMALDLLTGTIQAYIFAVLASVFIGAAIDEAKSTAAPPPSNSREHP